MTKVLGDKPHVFSSSLKFLSPYKKKVILIASVGICASVFPLVAPYLSQAYIDKAFLKRDIHVFFNVTVIGAILFFVTTIASFIQDIIKKRTSVKIKLSLTNSFMRKLYSLDLSLLQKKSVGGNIYRISVIEEISVFISERISHIVVDVCKFAVVLVVSLFINLRLTLAFIILSPLFLLKGVYVSKKIRSISETIWRINAQLFKKAQEGFSHMLVIKALQLESIQRRIYIRILIQNIRTGLEGFRWFILGSLGSAFLSKAIYGGISLYGGWLIIQGKVSLGNYTAAMLYIALLGGLIQSLCSSYEYLLQETIILDKFFEIMKQQPQIQDSLTAKPLDSLRKGIFLREITFAYEENKPVIKNLSLSIPAGLWIGIAGPSGSGKTTLINLILRLFDTQGGQIFIDDLELKEISLNSLHKRIAIATQEPLLFDVSIKENILCGISHLSSRQLEEIGEIVQLDNCIHDLPHGYDTLIGEGGCFLSQGHKQKVALARALARNPDLLILDEATSSIDSATEEKILTVIRAQRKGRSTIVISHRLATIRDADMLYFLRQDGIVEWGRHEELLSKSASYRESFQNQMYCNFSPPTEV